MGRLRTYYESLMDYFVEKLTLTDLEIAIAEGKVVEFKDRKRKATKKHSE